MVHVLVYQLHLWVLGYADAPPLEGTIALALAATAVIGLARASRHRWAYALTAASMAVGVVTAWPYASNHAYMQLLVAIVLVALPRPDEPVETLRWVAALILIQGGVQKVLHGTWFRGQMLASYPADNHEFADVVRWFGNHADRAHLARLQGETGYAVGPYRLRGPVLLALSNAVWIGEIAAGVALAALRKHRDLAVGVALAVIVGLEIVARELMFGFFLANLVLLWTDRDWNRRAALPMALLYAVFVLSGVGILPDWGFN